MPKPIFRWTCGPCLQQGLDILVESTKRTIQAFGENTFDYMIFYNGLSETNIDFLKKNVNVKLVAQNWANLPIQDEFQTPQRNDGSFEWNGISCGGTLWKVCPPRVRMDVHEIVMDNDVIILKKFKQIDQFLNQREKVLILEEPIKFYGRYDKFFPMNGPYLNSGFMGFPPGYDFGKEIKRYWEFHGSLKKISQADEQGLLMFTLNQTPSIRISAKQMVEMLGRDFNNKVTGQEEALHFTQSNKMPNHRAWKQYQEIMMRKYYV